MDFSHLQKLEIKGKTAEFELDDIPWQPVPVLILKPATQHNKGYFNASLKSSGHKLAKIKRGNIDEKMLMENRKIDRKLFPEYVVVGWRNVVDSNYDEVPFTKENCTEFLDNLPDWLFDKIREFAVFNENFMPEQIDVEEVSKN